MILMGRNLRSAKSNLRDSKSILGDLVSAIQGELIVQSNVMSDSLHQRVDSLYELMLDTAEVKDAVVAGSLELQKELNNEIRLQSKNSEMNRFSLNVQVIADSLTQSKALHSRTDDILRSSIRENDDCVCIIERFTSDLRKLAAAWEAQARELDELLSDVVDANFPIEVYELEKKLNEVALPMINTSLALNQEEE